VTGLIGRGIAQEMSTGSEDDEVTTGLSAGDADAFSVYKILDGETKLNYRAEQGYIYPCKRPCNYVSEESCTRGCVGTADHFAQITPPPGAIQMAHRCVIHTRTGTRPLGQNSCARVPTRVVGLGRIHWIRPYQYSVEMAVTIKWSLGLTKHVQWYAINGTGYDKDSRQVHLPSFQPMTLGGFVRVLPSSKFH